MRNIKDYIGKNYAIHCDTQEKHDKIYELLKEQQYNYYTGHQDYWKNRGKEFCFGLDHSNLSFASVDWCKNNYTILKAEEFLEPESLVGRYLKCLDSKSNWRGGLKVGDCFEITKVDSDGHFYIDHFCLDKSRVQELKEFELMPNGWTPEKEKPKFEKDKWYIIDCYHTTYYIKFDKLYDNDTWILASDYIPINGPKVMGSGGFRDYKNARAVNLSEIQQYLPDNHPDKQKPEETKPNLSDLYNTYIPLNNEEEYKQLLKFLPTIGFKLAHNNYFKGCPSPTIEFYKNDVFNVLANGGQVYNKKLSISDLAKYGFTLQQTSENMFKKGDYIVITKDVGSSSFKYNYCYKQRENYHYLRSELDSYSHEYNELCVISSKCNSNWRYATKEEENEYNRLNKPFDVTTLVKNQPIMNNEEWVPQVNEWVVRTTTCKMENRWKEGYVFKVLKICGDTAIENDSYHHKIINLRKALPHEIPIEKHSMSLNSNVIEVGDEVELVSGCSYAGYNIGDKAIVIEKNSNNINFSVYQKGTTKIISGCAPQYWKIIKKNNTPQTTNTKTDDFGSLQVTNAQTTVKINKNQRNLDILPTQIPIIMKPKGNKKNKLLILN